MLNKLILGDLVRGFPKLKFTNDKICNVCKKGKKTKSSFKAKKEVKSTRSLQLLHMDLCGQVIIQSREGTKLILVVIDNLFRYTWNMFLKTKYEIAGQLIIFAKVIQSKLNCKIGSIRFDNGTEFENSQIEEFCANNGITHNYSTPRTSQHNGSMEIKNKTLVENS